MKRMAKSVGYAVSGLVHAVSTERNIQQFLIGFFIYCCIGVSVHFDIFEWVIVAFAAGCFLIVELINTAIERLADTVDDGEKKKNGGHYHTGIKQAKDVAAAASLIALIMVGVILVPILLSHVMSSWPVID